MGRPHCVYPFLCRWAGQCLFTNETPGEGTEHVVLPKTTPVTSPARGTATLLTCTIKEQLCPPTLYVGITQHVLFRLWLLWVRLPHAEYSLTTHWKD